MMQDKVSQDPNLVIEYALSMQNLYKELKATTSMKSITYCSWKPSHQDFLKLNVDGVIFFYQHKAGMAVILGNTKGDLVMVASKLENEVHDPITIELLAMFRGLELCASMGNADIILESNCLLMIKNYRVLHIPILL